MKENETVREMTQGQLKDIVATMIGAIPKLTFQEAERITGNKGKFISGVKKAFNLNAVKEFSIWRKLQLGTGLKTGEEFSGALKGGGFKTSGWANDIMGKPKFAASISPVTKEIDLCVLTTEQIIGRSGTTAEVLAGIKEIGELLPAEAGPQLRLQYRDQPAGEWLLIAMEPIEDSDGDPNVFDVGRDGGGLWLGACYDGPGGVWSPDYHWVFALRK